MTTRERTGRKRTRLLPHVLTTNCAKRCRCPTPVKAECGCVNHNGGEITHCPLHAEAEAMARILRDTVCYGCSQRYGDILPTGERCVSCTVPRALLDRLDDAP
jgi:hypothetical protein